MSQNPTSFQTVPLTFLLSPGADKVLSLTQCHFMGFICFKKVIELPGRQTDDDNSYPGGLIVKN